MPCRPGPTLMPVPTVPNSVVLCFPRFTHYPSQSIGTHFRRVFLFYCRQAGWCGANRAPVSRVFKRKKGKLQKKNNRTSHTIDRCDRRASIIIQNMTHFEFKPKKETGGKGAGDGTPDDRAQSDLG